MKQQIEHLEKELLEKRRKLQQAWLEYEECKDSYTSLKAIYEASKMAQELSKFPFGYVSRKQAMHLLNCKKTKFSYLIKNNIISHTGSGHSRQFSLQDIKSYLQLHHVKSTVLDNRMDEAAEMRILRAKNIL